jgi:hypothetical protein
VANSKSLRLTIPLGRAMSLNWWFSSVFIAKLFSSTFVGPALDRLTSQLAKVDSMNDRAWL